MGADGGGGRSGPELFPPLEHPAGMKLNFSCLPMDSPGPACQWG